MSDPTILGAMHDQEKAAQLENREIESWVLSRSAFLHLLKEIEPWELMTPLDAVNKAEIMGRPATIRTDWKGRTIVQAVWKERNVPDANQSLPP